MDGDADGGEIEGEEEEEEKEEKNSQSNLSKRSSQIGSQRSGIDNMLSDQVTNSEIAKGKFSPIIQDETDSIIFNATKMI